MLEVLGESSSNRKCFRRSEHHSTLSRLRCAFRLQRHEVQDLHFPCSSRVVLSEGWLGLCRMSPERTF